MPVRLRVVSDRDPDAVRTFTPLMDALFVVGREDSSDCVLADDPKVSRQHCRFEYTADGWVVRDLGSTNGLRVNDVSYGGKNGKRGADGSVPAVQLKLGDSVRVGGSTLILEDPTLHDTSEETASHPISNGSLALEDPLGHFCAKCGSLISNSSVVVIEGRTLCFSCRAAGEADPVTVVPVNAPAGLPKVDGYDVVRQVGDGGMGRVFLAYRILDGAKVAVKLLSVDQTTDLLAFKRETDIMRSLRHENIVTFHEAGHTAEGRPYIIMEYMPGGTLHQMIRHRKIVPVSEAVSLIRQMLSGLAVAHALGIIHRDIKPLNVMLDESRKMAKLMDFGLAKSFLAAGLSGFTKTGVAAGSINYLPPEQLSNYKRVTPAADVFAVAATSYEMLSGASPYTVEDGDFVSAVLNHAMTPLARRCPKLPLGLTSLMDRALAKAPGERFANAGEMLAALDKL